MNIISVQSRLPTRTNSQKTHRNDAASERRKPVINSERRRGGERRVASQNIPVELRSGPDRRQQNRVSIST